MRWWKIGFAVSLALNLFFIAGIATLAYRAGGGGPFPPSALRAAERVLDEPGRTLARDIRREIRGDFRQVLREGREARREAQAALLAEPFDADALRAALARANTAFQRGGQVLGDGFVDLAERLSPEQRRQLSEAIEQGRHRRGDGDQGRGRDREHGRDPEHGRDHHRDRDPPSPR